MLLPRSTQSRSSWVVSIAITNTVWVKRLCLKWYGLSCSAVQYTIVSSPWWHSVVSLIFQPISHVFFNFSYIVELKSRLLEISFLIPALCCEVQRTNVSSLRWHSFVPLIFPGPHSLPYLYRLYLSRVPCHFPILAEFPIKKICSLKPRERIKLVNSKIKFAL